MFSVVWAKPHRFQNSGETNTEWAVVVWLGAGCQRSSLMFSLPIGQSSESPAVLGSRKHCSACTIYLCSPKGRGQSWREEELPPLVVVHIASENLHWTLIRAMKDLRELMPNGYENNLWFTEPKMALGLWGFLDHILIAAILLNSKLEIYLASSKGDVFALFFFWSSSFPIYLFTNSLSYAHCCQNVTLVTPLSTLFIVLYFWGRNLLSSSGRPKTCDLPVSVSQVKGSQLSNHTQLY